MRFRYNCNNQTLDPKTHYSRMHLTEKHGTMYGPETRIDGTHKNQSTPPSLPFHFLSRSIVESERPRLTTQ